MMVTAKSVRCNAFHTCETPSPCNVLVDYNPFCDYNSGYSTKIYFVSKVVELELIMLFEDQTKHIYKYPIRITWFDV